MRRRGRRGNRRQKDSGAPKWMVTYSDMVTLILVFFILLFSMSQIDLVKFQAISESFRNRMVFDFLPPSSTPIDYPTEGPSEDLHVGGDPNDMHSFLPSPDHEEDDNGEDKEDSLAQLVEDVETFLDEEQLHNVITANRTERGVVLVLQESILFDPGKAIILESGEPFLTKVGKLLTEIPNSVKVEGHTDTVPMSSYRYPSNWELSGARASSVIRYILDEFPSIDESRFSLAGFGETRPVKPNTNKENMRQNRRVEIIILNEATEEEEKE